MNDLDSAESARGQLEDWFLDAVDRGASDLHIVAGHPPVLRVQGAMQELKVPRLDQSTVDRVLISALPDGGLERFRAEKNLDFSLQRTIRGQLRRFRANYFVSFEAMGACFRVIPDKIPDFEWAGFPIAVAQRLAHFRNGLVLFTGVAGSGKTTSLAMIIDLLNQESGYRIITIEEPIEYVFKRRPKSVITQREVGVDVHSFADGLKYALRQDPNVILVGEIRDRDTVQMALSAAETGHLIFSTIHTRDAKGAISRITDMFPQDVQTDIRAQLSLSLRAVISQHLLPSDEGEKRELALELMFNNTPIASAIRFGKLESIDNYILTGRSQGMVTLDESVRELLAARRIRRPVAERYVSDPSRL